MKKILVVDDEADFALSVKKNLEASGEFTVTVCSTSTSAVAMAKDLKPDIILMDIMMPGKSGPEIAEELLSKAETKSIPVVFLTAVITDDEIPEDQNLIGNHLFIAKPVRTQELIRVINQGMGR